MIQNLWNNTKIYCGNHDRPVEMVVKQGPKSIFYACPEYGKRYQGERGCPNRISVDAVEKVLNHISCKLEEAGNNTLLDLTNYTFTLNGIKCTVIKHRYGAMSLSIINQKAFIR